MTENMDKRNVGEEGSADDYTADSIDYLTQRQHLLKRMGLTFGPEGIDDDYPYSSQKTVAIREIVDNATDEIRGGYGSRIRLHIRADGGVVVQDSGRGIPTGVNRKTGWSGIYMAMGVIQSGGKFSTNSDRFSSGLNGVGGSSSCAVSRRCDIIVFQKGRRYELSFKDGEPGYFDAENGPDDGFTTLKEMGKDLSYLRSSKDTRTAEERDGYETGTIVRIWLDDKVFTSPKPFDHQDIVNRLQWTAFLVPGLQAEVIDELHPIEGKPFHDVFHYPDGVVSMVDFLAPPGEHLPVQLIETEGHFDEETNVLDPDKDVVVKRRVRRRVPIQVAFTYTPSDYEYHLNSFVNTVHTKLGGVHVQAFESALVESFNEKLTSMRGLIVKGDDNPIIDDYREGLTVVLSIEQSEPDLSPQSKDKLGGAEVKRAIRQYLSAAFAKWIAEPKNKPVLDAIAKKVATASHTRQTAAADRANKRRMAQRDGGAMPAKLDECEFAGDDGSELLICEGDSAKGGISDARDSRYQAVLPIRGKIINAMTSARKEVLGNKEVMDIIQCLGAGYGGESCPDAYKKSDKPFDVEKMRYDRVLMATDADVDGFHIQDLLLVLFWCLFRPVIDEGRLYVTNPPLFEIRTKGKSPQRIYAKDEDELAEVQRKLDSRRVTYAIKRNKGLGENSKEATWTTMLDPKSRTLTRITAEDVEQAVASLKITMGKDPKARKDWLRDNADNFDRNLIDA